MRYGTHYTIEEARALLPKVRTWLKQLERCRTEIVGYDKQLTAVMAPGRDVGGETVNAWVKAHPDLGIGVTKLKRQPMGFTQLIAV